MPEVRDEKGQEEDVDNRVQQGCVRVVRIHIVMLLEGLLLRIDA